MEIPYVSLLKKGYYQDYRGQRTKLSGYNSCFVRKNESMKNTTFRVYDLKEF